LQSGLLNTPHLEDITMCHSSAKFSNKFSGCVLRDDDDEDGFIFVSRRKHHCLMASALAVQAITAVD
jgi:hypothetical protein